MGWQSFGEYLERLDSGGLGVNVAAFVGHGAVHRAVMGDELRTPAVDETRRMAELVAESFDQGAYGFSTGLEYWPGNICAPEHIIPLCEVAARRDRLYATHVRNRDAYYDLGFGEALCTARNASARLQISHIQPKYGAPPHAMDHSLEMIESVRRQGVDVAFDIIPHDWSHTLITAILPPLGAGRRCLGNPRTAEGPRDARTDEAQPQAHVAARHRRALGQDRSAEQRSEPPSRGRDVRGHRPDAEHFAVRRGARSDRGRGRANGQPAVDLAQLRQR